MSTLSTKFHSLLVGSALCFSLISCEKTTVPEPIAVEIRYDNTVMDVSYPENSKYLYTYRNNNILDKHTTKLREELAKRKLIVVNSGADYVINIDKIVCKETVANEELHGEYYQLAQITNIISYTLVDEKNNESRQLRIAKTNKDFISYVNDAAHITGFKGTDGSFEETAEKSAKRLKKLIEEME